MMDVLSVAIVKPINGACNISCSYCYMNQILDPQRSARTVMTTKTLRATIDFFCSQQNDIEFTWHGGEPLLAGKEFYRKVAKFQKVWELRGRKITNFVQTNGILVDQEWAELFASLGFYVGVSLDAPAIIHDNLRSNSFEKVLLGINQLRKYNNFNGVICCVGKRNVNKPEMVIDFFLQHGIKSIKFSRVKDNDQETISAKQYANFLIKVFNYWIQIDDQDLEIRDIKSIVDLLLGGQFRECSFAGRCGRFATVYSDGAIFACDRFLNEPHLQFGTVFDSYHEVLRGDNFQRFLVTIEKTKELCSGCRWSSLCNGGCFKDRISDDHADVCKANQELFEKIEVSLKNFGLLV